jgi:hypothetical protein
LSIARTIHQELQGYKVEYLWSTPVSSVTGAGPTHRNLWNSGRHMKQRLRAVQYHRADDMRPQICTEEWTPSPMRWESSCLEHTDQNFCSELGRQGMEFAYFGLLKHATWWQDPKTTKSNNVIYISRLAKTMGSCSWHFQPDLHALRDSEKCCQETWLKIIKEAKVTNSCRYKAVKHLPDFRKWAKGRAPRHRDSCVRALDTARTPMASRQMTCSHPAPK